MFSSPRRGSSPAPSYINSIPSSPDSMPPKTFSTAVMEDNIAFAEEFIRKWDIEASTYTKMESLFTDNRNEAKEFVNSVRDLQSAMRFFIKENSTSELLVRAQKLMNIAMKRLQKEFYSILSINRKFLDPESVSTMSSRASARSSSVSDFKDDDVGSEEENAIQETASTSISEEERISERAKADLKFIADCMIASGYGKECVKVYKIIRKSIVDESLYFLGVEKFSFSQIQKMDWDVMETKIKTWSSAMRIAVKTLFHGERILSDHVFSGSERIKESCFSEISKEGALMLFGFLELVAKCKKSPEKMFRTLDLYESISDLWPEIESIFSYESTSAVLSQALTSLDKLRQAVRLGFTDFEAAIEKDTSKSPLAGGGLHPLSRYVMNYVVFLSDYSGVLSEILADWHLPARTPLPESYFTEEGVPESEVSVGLAWLILALLCKLDSKAELYKDVSLSYLFLANNLNYVVTKVRKSNLKLLLGGDWLSKHEVKAKQYASNYERMAWSKVMTLLPENPMADMSRQAAADCFKRFNSAFEEAYRKQGSWVVPDPKLRDEIKVSVAMKLVPAYLEFYEKYRVMFVRGIGNESIVRYAPDDFQNHLSDLLHGNEGGAGNTTSHLSPSHSREGRGR